MARQFAFSVYIIATKFQPTYLKGVYFVRICFKLSDFLDSVDVAVPPFPNLAEDSELSTEGLHLVGLMYSGLYLNLAPIATLDNIISGGEKNLAGGVTGKSK